MRDGFVVDEPSNAAHVAMLAWGWVRETGRNDVMAALHVNRQDMDVKITTIHQGIERQLGVINVVHELKGRLQPTPSIDTDSIAAAFIKAMPPLTASIKVNTSLLKNAVMESVSKL